MIKNFDKKILKYMQKAHISALSTSIVAKDKTVLANGYGIANREKNIDADENTIYLMASNSKSITATAVMMLFEKGLFNLDDDVNSYLPMALRNPRYLDKPITFRMLLSHTSSLAPQEGGLFFKNYYKPELLENFYLKTIPADLKVENYPFPFLKDYLLPDGVNYRPQVWTNFPPGEEMVYSNIAFSLLGHIIEKISGQSFNEYCRKNIFKPLEMNNSSFSFLDVDRSKLAIPYEFQNGEYISLIPYSFLDNSAGNFRTTVSDLSHFLIAHMNGGIWNDVRILKEESIREMHTIQCDKTKHNFNYGFGWQITGKNTNKLIFNGGGFWGLYAKMRFYPHDRVGVIYLANTSPVMNRNIKNILNKTSTFRCIESLLFKKGFLDY
jgi:CubicO group peptidase (beta-lactamase class C family)